MNKNLSFVAAVLALSLGWAGCNKAGKLAQNSANPPPSGPVELKLKWPQGERIVLDMDTRQGMELTMPGQPVPMKQGGTMGQEYGLTVLQELPDGGHEVEMDFRSARLSSTQGSQQVLNYDSAHKSTMQNGDSLAAMFGKILGSKIRFFLNASNEIVRMEGAEELASRLSSGATDDQLALLKDNYSEGSLRQLMSQYHFLPPNPVQPGDTWPVRFEFPRDRMGTLLVDLNFTLKSWEMHGKRMCARLEFQGSINSKPNPDATPSGMSISNLEGTASGVSWFDPELGLVIDTTMNEDLSMVINVPNPRAKQGDASQMLSITNQMNQVVNVKLASVE